MKTYNHEIHKRTFTGPNDNPITSVYSKSKKGCITYNRENYIHTLTECLTSKKDCVSRIEQLKGAN